MIKKIFLLVLSFAAAIFLAEWVAANFAYIDTPPGLFQDSATRNFEHTPYFRGRDRLKNPIAINSMGLRDGEYAIPKPAGVYRILVLGDSVAFGDGVKTEDTFSKQLEELLKKDGFPAEVLNGGVRGYNTYDEMKMFEEVGLRYRPDLVILSYVLNDAEPNAKQKGLIDRRHGFLITAKNFVKKHSYLYALLRRDLELWRHQVTPAQFLETYDDQFSPDHEGWKTSYRSLERIQSLSRERGADFFVALVPRLEGLRPGETYPCLKIHRQIDEACRGLGIPLIDLLDFFKGEDPARLKIAASDIFHPNGYGHGIIARALESYILRHYLKPIGKNASAGIS